MNAMRHLVLVPLIVLASSLAAPAEIIDNAKMFDPATLKKAEAKLDRTEQLTKIPVRIETIESLRGADPNDLAKQKAQQWGKPGLFVLMAKKEQKIQVRDFRGIVGNRGDDEIRNAFTNSFKAKDFDGGLIKGVEMIGDVLATATPVPGRAVRKQGGQFPPGQPQRQNKSSFPWWATALIIGAVVWIGMRVLGGLFGGKNRMAGQPQAGPGGGGYPQGGPGYGGGYGGRGGGGFMSSLFGGIGGAMAGNWLYGQFSGRNHDSGNMSPDQGTNPADDPSTGAWGGGGGDWGGGGGDAGGGGDWGGGGGDWGGGGGDGGGGGGGDW